MDFNKEITFSNNKSSSPRLLFSIRLFLLILLPLLIFTACGKQSTDGSTEENDALASVPTRDQVGAAQMPDEIAPVSAPFDMPAFEKPEFPDQTVNIKDLGAGENENVRHVINNAIDSISKAGGGTVIIPEGEWKSGRISLKDNVNLHIKDGAVVRFSGKIKDYLPAVFTRNEGIEVNSLGACIYAHDQENIAITGGGKLIGPPDSSEVRTEIMTQDVIEKVVPHDMPVEERVYVHKEHDFIFPPTFIGPVNSKDVYIEGVTLEHSAFWNVVPVYCDGVIIRGITVNSVGVSRGDGIDVESSRNVLIEYSTLNTGDDCFTMKAGRGKDGLRVNKPTENVVVRHCLAKKGHGGITCGSETAGTIRNLYVHDCVFDNTCVGIRFKTRRPRGGGGENLHYERIRMDLECTIIKWDMLGEPMYVGELAERLPPREVTDITPFYRNISIKDFIVENGTHFVKIYGIPESPLTNVTIENGRVNSERLIRANDARDVTIRDVNIQAQDSLIEVLGSKNLSFENVNFDVPGGKLFTQIEGERSDSIIFRNTNPSKPNGWDSEVWTKE